MSRPMGSDYQIGGTVLLFRLVEMFNLLFRPVKIVIAAVTETVDWSTDPRRRPPKLSVLFSE